MSYFQEALVKKDRQTTIQEALRILTPISDTFNAIAFRGVSGAVIAPILAWEMDKCLIPIRKSGEHAHSYVSAELDACQGMKELKVLIVDDFIASGATIRAIVESIGLHRKDAGIAGVYFYCASSHTKNKYWNFCFPCYKRD